MRSRIARDLVKMTLTTGGSDNRVVNAAITNYAALDSGSDGKTIAGKFWEGSTWEIGEYVYTHSSKVLARSRLIRSSTGAAITFTSAATFAEVWTSRDAERCYPPDGYYYVEDYASTAAQLEGTSDVTTEFQALFDAIQTDARAAGGGEYVVDLTNVNLLLSGALQDTSGRNAQIILPTMRNGSDATPDVYTELAIISRRRKNLDYSVVSTSFPAAPYSPGGRITSTVTGTLDAGSAIFTAKNVTSATSPFVRLGLHFENIEIYTAGYTTSSGVTPSSNITAINALYAQQMIGKNLFVVGGPLQIGKYAAMSTSGAGVRWPTNNNNVQVFSNNCIAVGFTIGHVVGEHHHGDLHAALCKWAIEVPFLYHSYNLTRLEAQYCPYGIRGTGGTLAGVSYGSIALVNQEVSLSNSPSTVFNRVYDVDDASNNLHGSAVWHMVQGGVGVVSNAVVKNGGSNFAGSRIA